MTHLSLAHPPSSYGSSPWVLLTPSAFTMLSFPFVKGVNFHPLFTPLISPLLPSPIRLLSCPLLQLSPDAVFFSDYSRHTPRHGASTPSPFSDFALRLVFYTQSRPFTPLSLPLSLDPLGFLTDSCSSRNVTFPTSLSPQQLRFFLVFTETLFHTPFMETFSDVETFSLFMHGISPPPFPHDLPAYQGVIFFSSGFAFLFGPGVCLRDSSFRPVYVFRFSPLCSAETGRIFPDNQRDVLTDISRYLCVFFPFALP